MELNITYDDAQDLLRATYHGPYSLLEAKATFSTILEAMAQHQTLIVLVDARGVTGWPTTSERLDYSQFIAEAVRDIEPPPRFAYTMVEPVLDKHHFGETVARNRGMAVRVFNNIEEAEQWILQARNLIISDELRKF